MKTLKKIGFTIGMVGLAILTMIIALGYGVVGLALAIAFSIQKVSCRQKLS